ncbi:hypothetical protein [Mycobacterium marinum]|nr:hypothetical protein [Mycobacterium marinum]
MNDIITRAEAALEGVTKGPWWSTVSGASNVWLQWDRKDERPKVGGGHG